MSTPQMSPYKDELTKAMTFLAEKEDTIFIGQQIVYAGNPMSTTLTEVPKEKMIEVPVMEETQMGMSLGLAMTGKSVITFYPRWDFLISATNQLINHLDKFEHMTDKMVNVIIRVGVGSKDPLDPGIQHRNDYTKEFKSMLQFTKVHELKNSKDIYTIYTTAYNEGGVHIVVEWPELYYKN
jgi:pyruvate/2-oxoglutarate/acetoin dehydrogenase E1 component